MADNKSFVLRAPLDVAFEERPIPSVEPNQVLVEVKKTGICGSDVHFYTSGRLGHVVAEKPMVLGHESAGIISKVGSKVTGLQVGDRIAMECGVACNVCDICKAGKYQLCPFLAFPAFPPDDGTLARYYVLPSHLAVKLPDNLSLEDGAMIEPLAVAVHATKGVAKVRPNDTVVVFGCGPVGLLCMATARVCGARRIIAVDINPARLEFAHKYAATDVFLSPPREKEESKMEYGHRTAKLLKEALDVEDFGPKSVDVVLEASGSGVQTGLLITKIGGTYVQVGNGEAEQIVPVALLLVRETVFKGSSRYGAGDYALSVALVAAGKIDLKPLVTHRFAFEDSIVAFESAKVGKGPDGKPMIKSIISGPDVLPSEAM